MDAELIELLQIVVVFVVIFVLLPYMNKVEKRRRKNLPLILQYLADRFGLKTIEPEKPASKSFFANPFSALGSLAATATLPYLTGEISGLSVTLQPATETRGRNTVRTTTLNIPIAEAAGRDFLIEPMRRGYTALVRKELFVFLKKNRPVENIRTGDRVFDELFYLKAGDANFLKHILNATVRHKLVEALGRYGPNWWATLLESGWSIELGGGTLSYQEQAHWADTNRQETYTAIVDAMLELARVTSRIAHQTRG